MMGFADMNALVHEMEELVRVVEPLGFALGPGSVDALLVASDALCVLSGATAGESPDVKRLMEWVKTTTQRERERSGSAAPAPKPPAPMASPPPGPGVVPAAAPAPAPVNAATAAAAVAPPLAKPSDASIRISQQSLETLTSTANNLSQRSRSREVIAARRRQLARDLVQLHRLAEDLGPEAHELAQRLGRAKEAMADINRIITTVNTEELRDLAVISEEIQALRMVPIGTLFEVYPRMVRELSRDLGKELDLVLDGGDEKADRSVIDALKEPLMHLVRNAVDHGLESREDRVDAGKSTRGTLRLEATRDGERLVLRVVDDGRGLSPQALREVAVRKGLVSLEAAERLGDAAACDLIFLPGFTSKETVSDVSGRGIGLDLVRLRLAQVGGEVTVTSKAGFGTTFELRVPLSLTLAPVLFVEAGDERLCLTASNVMQALQVDSNSIREVAGRPALAVVDEVLPFATVASVLGVGDARPPTVGELVLVVRGRGQQAVLAVDRVLDERVQPIFPLKGLLSGFAHLSGATPQADGTLSLVLSAAHLVAAAHGRVAQLADAAPRGPTPQKHRILVVDDSPLTRELLVSLLETAGYLVVQANDGAEALELLRRQTVDLVATDLEMPNVDGIELTRRLKHHDTLAGLPVVIVTTRGSEADRRRGVEAGANGYVTKGDQVRQELLDVVARLLSQRYRV